MLTAALISLLIVFIIAMRRWLYRYAPAIRESRIAALNLERTFHRALPWVHETQNGQLPAQAQFYRLQQAGQHASKFQARAQTLPFPIPDVPTESTPPTKQLEGLQGVLSNKYLGLAVSGGEQLAQNLAEMALPGAMEHLATHATSGAIHAAQHFAGSTDILKAFGKGLLESIHEHGSIHLTSVFASVGLDAAKDMGKGAALELWTHAPQEFNLSDAQGCHIPWATLILSSARELTLFADGKKDLETAVGHILLDTAATAGGAAGGAKVGAIVGAFFGPLGVAVGGLGGAVVGAIIGKSIATNIRHADLNRELENYQCAYARCTSAIEISAGQLIKTVREHGLGKQTYYLSVVATSPQFSNAELVKLRLLALEIREATVAVYADRLQELRGLSRDLRRSIDRPSFLAKVFCLSVHHIAIDILNGLEDDERDRLHALQKSLPSKAIIRHDPVAALKHLLGSGVPSELAKMKAIRGTADILQPLVEKRWEGIGEWVANVAMSYRSAVLDINTVLTIEAARHQAVIEAQKPEIEQARLRVDAERSKVGA